MQSALAVVIEKAGNHQFISPASRRNAAKPRRAITEHCLNVQCATDASKQDYSDVVQTR